MRGRISRATYWLFLGVLVTLVAVLGMFTARPPRVSEGVLIFLCVPRLHDLGRSGWWVLIPLGIEVVALVVVAVAASLPDVANVAVGTADLINASLVVLLGLIPGQPHANRFGEPPKSIFPFKERRKIRETEEIFK